MRNLIKNNGIKNDAKIFLTDYASYNNGSQFEFGHWVDLNDFDRAEELSDYIQQHFKECDETSPLDSPREEIMITDYEGFPKSLYSECMNFETLFKLFDYCEANGIESLENKDDNLLSIWNEYCKDNRLDDEIYHFDDDTLKMMFGNDPMKAFMAGVNAQINWSDNYLVFDGYANIKSVSDPSYEIDEKILIHWLIEKI